MHGVLEPAAPNVPPLLEGGPAEFVRSVAYVGRQALQSLPDDVTDVELFAIRDIMVDLARALSAIPDLNSFITSGARHYLTSGINPTRLLLRSRRL